MKRHWTFGDWFVFVGIPVLVCALLGAGVYSIVSINSMAKQEQQFANTFYDQCMKAHGVYSSGSTGYVCFGNGSILFQSGSGTNDTTPKG